MVKRGLDVCLALLGLAVLWPVLLACAIAVKRDSVGPIFYRGSRTGLHGKPFRIWKFRSMVIDAEDRGGTTTGGDDPRITRVGRVLRKYKLDELPQLWNVLRGDMSFVGPRPEVAEYTDLYTLDERRILDVRPGITDLSSIEFSDLQAHVGIEDPDETYRRVVLPRKNRLRLQYVDQQSLSLDLEILVRTVALVASRPLRKGSGHAA
jgi:lipopolysaccharide/colanic/teichoic acid biosynthesis glycosyltransferase